MKRMYAFVGLLALCSSNLYAQERQGYVAGLSGITFGTASAPAFGVEAGKQISSVLAVYGTFGRLQDTTPKGVIDFFNEVGNQRGTQVGIVQPATYVVGGLKVFLPMRGSARPYALGGLGVVRLGAPTLKEDGVDVSAQVRGQPGFAGDSGRMLEFGGGVEVARGALHLDLGYRFMQVAEGTSPSRLHAAAGFRF